MQASAYDAWKNFILVLAGVLAGNVLTSAWSEGGFILSAHNAIARFLEFDKWHKANLENCYVISILTALVVLYFVKSIHGILVAIYSDGFYKQAKGNSWAAMKLLMFATLTVISLTFAPAYFSAVANETTIFRSGAVLMSMVAVPTLIFMLFDMLRFNPDRHWLANLRRTSNGLELDSAVTKWVLEDILLLFLLALWLVVVGLGFGSARFQIDWTLLTLACLLLVPSALDYVFNRDFFFHFPRVKQGKRPC